MHHFRSCDKGLAHRYLFQYLDGENGKCDVANVI